MRFAWLSWLVPVWLHTILASLFGRFMKPLTRYITGCCEIERIIQRGENAETFMLFFNSVQRSKYLGELRKALVRGEPSEEDVVLTIIKLKRIDVKKSSFQTASMKHLTTHCHRMVEQVALLRELDGMTKVPVTWEDHTHAEMLGRCLRSLSPLGVANISDSDASGKSDAWGSIGFQGKDPITDFRGMGVLALVGLDAMSTDPYRDKVCQLIKSISQDLNASVVSSKGGDGDVIVPYYPFAVGFINVLSVTMRLYREGDLIIAFSQRTVDLKAFTNVTINAMFAMHDSWAKSGRNTMEFTIHLKEWERGLTHVNFLQWSQSLM